MLVSYELTHTFGLAFFLHGTVAPVAAVTSSWQCTKIRTASTRCNTNGEAMAYLHTEMRPSHTEEGPSQPTPPAEGEEIKVQAEADPPAPAKVDTPPPAEELGSVAAQPRKRKKKAEKEPMKAPSYSAQCTWDMLDAIVRQNEKDKRRRQRQMRRFLYG